MLPLRSADWRIDTDEGGLTSVAFNFYEVAHFWSFEPFESMTGNKVIQYSRDGGAKERAEGGEEEGMGGEGWGEKGRGGERNEEVSTEISLLLL